MVTRDVQIQALRSLEANERGIARFYRNCAERFPTHAAVWKTLAAEEDTHALMIDVVRSLVEDARIDLGHRQSWGEVAALADEVRTRLDSLLGTPVSMAYAVVYADALERLFAESEALRVHEGDPPELARLLHHLCEDSRRHDRFVEELAGSYGPGGTAANRPTEDSSVQPEGVR